MAFRLQGSDPASIESCRKEIPRAAQPTQRNESSPLSGELLVAARKGYSSQVERLLREGGGAGAAVTDKHGRSCLHLACHYGHLDAATIILQSGLVDINCVSKRGHTPLHEASAEGHLSIVLLLLAYGAFIKARSRDGGTSLMSASHNGHLQIAKVLIAAGADVTAVNTNGYTALHFAAWKGHTSVVELLLKEGSSLSAEAANGKTAYQLAHEEKHHEIVTILHAALSRESEEPFYRIASLEGQLRQCQDKLREVQFHHEGVLAAERTAEEEKWVQVTQQLMEELDGVKSELALLKDSKKTETDEKPEEEAVPPKVTVSMAEPEVSVKSKGSKKKAKDLDRLREEEPLRKLSLGSALVSPLLKHKSRTRSASQDTLDGLGLDKVERQNGDEKTRLSLEGERLNGRHRPSITQLIEESMKNPQSMVAIRKELKSDGFTPKIQKKFHHSLATVASSQAQTTPPPLRTLKPTFRD